jgi:hypothetical protein
MGALDKAELAQVLKSQVVRKLTRLFFVVEGTYAIYVAPHAFGEGADLPLMRVDPRSVIYPGIRAAYDLPRVTQELTRLLGLRFRLQDLSAAFIAAMGMPPDDPTVEALRKGWMTLDDLDAVTSRPLKFARSCWRCTMPTCWNANPSPKRLRFRIPRFRERFTCRNPRTWARFSNSPAIRGRNCRRLPTRFLHPRRQGSRQRRFRARNLVRLGPLPIPPAKDPWPLRRERDRRVSLPRSNPHPLLRPRLRLRSWCQWRCCRLPRQGPGRLSSPQVPECPCAASLHRPRLAPACPWCVAPW